MRWVPVPKGGEMTNSSNYTKRITFLEEAWVVEALDEQVEAAQKQGLNIARSDVIRRLLRKGLGEQQEAKE